MRRVASSFNFVNDKISARQKTSSDRDVRVEERQTCGPSPNIAVSSGKPLIFPVFNWTGRLAESVCEFFNYLFELGSPFGRCGSTLTPSIEEKNVALLYEGWPDLVSSRRIQVALVN